MTGYWNAKVGKKIKQHASDSYSGSFARGFRNYSGQHLVDFCAVNNLFIKNTAFQHKVAWENKTTWENKRVHAKDLTKTLTVYNQIDYIFCREKIKHTLINARSFSGTETSSDHRLVICKLQVEKYLIFKNTNKTHSKSYNTFQFIKSEETKNAYQKQLHENLCKWDVLHWKISERVSPMQQ